MNRIARVEECLVYESEFGALYDDRVEWPSGKQGRHLRLTMGDGQPGVVIVPVCGELVGLVRTFRYPISQHQWGFPRGFAHDGDPLVTAGAELSEEMGLTGQLRLCGWFTPDSGVQESRVAVVEAIVADTAGAVGDVDEVDDVVWLPCQELWARLGTPGWEDGMTMAALTLMEADARRRAGESA